MLCTAQPNIIRAIKSRRMRLEGHVARMWERGGAYRVLVGKPGGKRPLWRTRVRWEDNIKMDFEHLGWWEVYWLSLAQERGRWRALVNALMNFRVVKCAENFLNRTGWLLKKKSAPWSYYYYYYCQNGLENFCNNLDAGRVTWSKLHTEDLQILGNTVQNLVVLAPVLCAPHGYYYYYYYYYHYYYYFVCLFMVRLLYVPKRSRDSSVAIVARLRDERPRNFSLIPCSIKRSFSPPKRPDRAWGSLRFLFNG